MLFSLRTLMAAAVAATVSWAAYVRLSRTGSRWIFTGIACLLAISYIGFWIVARMTESDREIAVADGAFSDWLVVLAPFVLVPLVALAVLIDLAVVAIRHLRSHSSG